jgi:hypothetical protein
MAVLCSGGSGSTGRCGLHHSASSSRVRARLSSRRVHAWLQPRAAAVASLSLDLTGAHDFTAAAVERLAFLLAPSLTRLRLAGAPVDASDCCEALGAWVGGWVGGWWGGAESQDGSAWRMWRWEGRAGPGVAKGMGRGEPW